MPYVPTPPGAGITSWRHSRMPLKIATWNVNSIRQRLDHLGRLSDEQAPDVLCLQETKIDDPIFPHAALEDLGYRHRVIAGQKAYNGVAILSRRPFADSGSAIWCKKDDKRHVWARFEDGLELHNFYVPSGGDTPDPAANPKFDHKLKFLRAMARWCRKETVADKRLILVGDLNVAPLETDVWNHKRLTKSVGHTPGESDLIMKLLKAGKLIDVPRRFVPPTEPLYSWWGYRFAAAFEKNYGWRLDHVFATASAAAEIAKMQVLKDTRTWDKPSDHVPVMVELG